jgi:hypothetical protein
VAAEAEVTSGAAAPAAVALAVGWAAVVEVAVVDEASFSALGTVVLLTAPRVPFSCDAVETATCGRFDVAPEDGVDRLTILEPATPATVARTTWLLLET